MARYLSTGTELSSRVCNMKLYMEASKLISFQSFHFLLELTLHVALMSSTSLQEYLKIHQNKHDTRCKKRESTWAYAQVFYNAYMTINYPSSQDYLDSWDVWFVRNLQMTKRLQSLPRSRHPFPLSLTLHLTRDLAPYIHAVCHQTPLQQARKARKLLLLS